MIGHRNETGEEKKFITNIEFDSAELVTVIARARQIHTELRQAHRNGSCAIDKFKRVVVVPG